MEAYQQQYMGPPPRQLQSSVDSNVYPNRFPPPARPPPHVPPQNSWYPNQFHYQPLQSVVSPPAHVAQQHNWGFPPPAPLGEHHNLPLQPCPPPVAYHSQYPPPPHPSHNPQIHHSYLPSNQNSYWGQQQGWNYSVEHNNADDWETKAKAWADAKKGVDQQPLSPFPLSRNSSEQHQVHSQQYHQDMQPQALPIGNASSLQALAACPVEHTSFTAGQSFSAASENLNHQFDHGSSAKAPTASVSTLKQEVPSSYSSVAVNYENNDQAFGTTPMSSSSLQENSNGLQQPSSSTKMVLPNHSIAYAEQPTGPGIVPREQPLNFAHTHHDLAFRGPAPPSSGSSFGLWVPNSATSSHYASPPTPIPPSVIQHDHNIMVPNITGNVPPPFGSFPPVPNFQPAPTSTTPFSVPGGFGMGTSFPGDGFGASNFSDRPKKASVPNWLKEEIIKNASAITRSTVDHPKLDSNSIDDDDLETDAKRDSPIFESSLSSDEEEEKYEEAARTASVNQEIKRVLTEVLLKVTDELFDEIATKVLADDDSLREDEESPIINQQKAKPSISISNEAKLLNVKEVDSNVSTSASHGNLLGLVNYDSDDDDNESAVSNNREAIHLEMLNSEVSKSLSATCQNDMEISNNGLRKLDASVSANVLKKISTHSNEENAETLAENNCTMGEKKSASFGSSPSGFDHVTENGKNDKRKSANSKRKNEDERRESEIKKDVNASPSHENEQGDRMKDKLKESKSKKSNQYDVKEANRYDKHLKRSHEQHKDEEKSKQKQHNDSSRHQRRRSPADTNRQRNEKSHVSSDDDSDDSRREPSSRKQSKISSSRYRERNVLRSPNSKHSQHRHSPYSSMDSTRGSKMRSRSPSRRHRR